MNNLYMFLAALVGSGLAVQAAVNTQLRAATGSALWASILSAGLTIVLLAGVQLVVRDSLTWPDMTKYPWWIWIGGIAGAVYVFAIAAFTRHLGVALMFGAIVAGQLLAGLIIDHFALFGAAAQRLSPTRIIGAALLLAGLALIRWK